MHFSFSQNNFLKYVDPFIGTGGTVHTYPGADYFLFHP